MPLKTIEKDVTIKPGTSFTWSALITPFLTYAFYRRTYGSEKQTSVVPFVIAGLCGVAACVANDWKVTKEVSYVIKHYNEKGEVVDIEKHPYDPTRFR